MDITLFITLLTIFSAITSICTEACKKLLEDVKISYASNILVFIIACIVGTGGTAIYYALRSIEFNTANVICMILMGLASAIGAMTSYDKIVQTISQLRMK